METYYEVEIWYHEADEFGFDGDDDWDGGKRIYRLPTEDKALSFLLEQKNQRRYQAGFLTKVTKERLY